MLKNLIDPLANSFIDPFHAQEGYRPTKVLPTGEMAFAHWTERVSAQSEFVAARELAGLPDTNLCALAGEFEKAPRRRRLDWLRHSYTAAGTALALAGLFGLAHLASTSTAPGLSAFEMMSAGSAVAALALASLGGIGSLRMAPLESAYSRVGLYVSVINEQHPWLYKTHLLMSDQAANEYRLKVLRERGPIRGVDYLMMREIANAHEGVQLTQTADSIVKLVQADGSSKPLPVNRVPEEQPAPVPPSQPPEHAY